MNEEKKTNNKFALIFLTVALIVSLVLNGYFLYKVTDKDDTYAICSTCGRNIYLYYNSTEGTYTTTCRQCISKQLRDEIEQELRSNSDYSYDNDAVPEENYAYVTRTGSKYHHIWCQYVSGKDDLSYYESSYEAESAGYDACSVCW